MGVKLQTSKAAGRTARAMFDRRGLKAVLADDYGIAHGDLAYWMDGAIALARSADCDPAKLADAVGRAVAAALILGIELERGHELGLERE